MSEPVAVSINVTAVDDVPTAHAFRYTLAEAKLNSSSNGGGPGIEGTVVGGAQVVQLLATDDPNEDGQPLELFITSLPTKGKVQGTGRSSSHLLTHSYRSDPAKPLGCVAAQRAADGWHSQRGYRGLRRRCCRQCCHPVPERHDRGPGNLHPLHDVAELRALLPHLKPAIHRGNPGDASNPHLYYERRDRVFTETTRCASFLLLCMILLVQPCMYIGPTATVTHPYSAHTHVGSPLRPHRCAAGGIVAVRVKTLEGTWLPLYTGTPLHKLGAEQGTQYWEWSPKVCQLNFKSYEIKVEIDTSIETGIFVGVVDYVKVSGTSEQQAAAIPFVVGGNTSLVYQANAWQSGSDSFTYAASDCPGDHSRMSTPSTVDLTIINSNDAPYWNTFWQGETGLEVDTQSTTSLNGLEWDTPSFQPGFGMTFAVVKMPGAIKMTTADGPIVKGVAMSPTRGNPIGGGRWFFALDVTMTSARCGADELLYTFSDGTFTSRAYSVTVDVNCPRPCSLSADVDWEESVCDQSTLTRDAKADWRNFSLSSNASGSCDLPRAPDLPSTVKVDCDVIDLDSSWAVNLIVAGAILATAKVALLVYALVHREAPIYKKAQVITTPLPASTE